MYMLRLNCPISRRSRLSLVALLLVAAFSVVGAPVALAQGGVETATDAQKEAARKAYADGKQYYEGQSYAAALSSFQKSYDNVASPNSKLMVARSLANLGRNAEAYAAYGETIAEAEGVEKYALAGQSAQSERAELEGKIGKLQVHAAPEAAGGTLTVQGRAVAEADWASPVIVDPGEVEVVLSGAAGEERQTVEVAPGAVASVTVGAPAPEPTEVVDPFAEPEPEEPAGPTPMAKQAQAGLVIGPKVGGGIGTSELGASYILELELGYALPFADRALEIFVSGQYTQPETDGTEGEPDPRLPGDGILKYEVTQQEFALSLGLLYRIDVGSSVMPYFGAGARLYMLNTKVTGESGAEPFGENEETQNDIGFLVVGGIDIFVGPGAVLAELQYGWAKVDGFVLRNTNVGQLNLAVGYRFIL